MLDIIFDLAKIQSKISGFNNLLKTHIMNI